MLLISDRHVTLIYYPRSHNYWHFLELCSYSSRKTNASPLNGYSNPPDRIERIEQIPRTVHPTVHTYTPYRLRHCPVYACRRLFALHDRSQPRNLLNMRHPTPEQIQYMQDHIDEDRRPWLVGVNVSFIAIAVVAVVLRFYARKKVMARLGVDDWLIAAAGVSVFPLFTVLSSLLSFLTLWYLLSGFFPRLSRGGTL